MDVIGEAIEVLTAVETEGEVTDMVCVAGDVTGKLAPNVEIRLK